MTGSKLTEGRAVAAATACDLLMGYAEGYLLVAQKAVSDALVALERANRGYSVEGTPDNAKGEQSANV